MDNEIKKIIKKELAPLLIGIRNDLEDYGKKNVTIKKNFYLEGKEVKIKGIKGKNGYTPKKDIDYPSKETLFDFVKENLPKKGKDYFTDEDIKDIVSKVKLLLPTKEELKGNDGVVDYSLVKEICIPIINSYNKKKDITQIKEIIRQKELSPEDIRNKLESLNGNSRLDAKSIKGLENYLKTFIATSSGGGGGGGSNVDLSGYVPYSGATSDLDLGIHNIKINETITTSYGRTMIGYNNSINELYYGYILGSNNTITGPEMPEGSTEDYGIYIIGDNNSGYDKRQWLMGSYLTATGYNSFLFGNQLNSSENNIFLFGFTGGGSFKFDSGNSKFFLNNDANSDSSNYLSIGASSTGIITFDAVGSQASFRFLDTIQTSGYKSSDGSAGATANITLPSGEILVFKNGLYIETLIP